MYLRRRPLFLVQVREGHLKAAKRILAYLKTFSKERVTVDTTYTDQSKYC
jgi:hypothetical protein